MRSSPHDTPLRAHPPLHERGAIAEPPERIVQHEVRRAHLVAPALADVAGHDRYAGRLAVGTSTGHVEATVQPDVVAGAVPQTIVAGRAPGGAELDRAIGRRKTGGIVRRHEPVDAAKRGTGRAAASQRLAETVARLEGPIGEINFEQAVPGDQESLRQATASGVRRRRSRHPPRAVPRGSWRRGRRWWHRYPATARRPSTRRRRRRRRRTPNRRAPRRRRPEPSAWPPRARRRWRDGAPDDRATTWNSPPLARARQRPGCRPTTPSEWPSCVRSTDRPA